MRPTGFLVATAIGAAFGACGGSKPQADANTGPDSLRFVDFKEVTGTVIGADSSMPRCPVKPHFSAVMVLSHLSGKLQYRWERSTGSMGPTHEVEIPSAARTGMVDLPVEPDEWESSERGVQLWLTNRIHVLAPIDKMSPPVDVQLKCF